MKKVLFIVYAWPPAGGPGVQRCLKFVKYLPQFGWEPIVLTVEGPETPAKDQGLLGQVSSKLQIYKTSRLEPFTTYKKLTGRRTDQGLETGHVMGNEAKSFIEKLASWVRLNLFVPDAKIGWWPYAVSTGKQILETDTIDIIFSSGPPHTAHLIARSLAKFSNLPWVADFRDPWVDMNYYQFAKRSAPAIWLDHKLEASCLRSASATTTVSKSLVSLFNNKIAAPKTYLLPNGYDPTDLPETIRPQREPQSKLKIYYGGNISASQTSETFIQVVANLNQQLDSPEIQISLAGKACKEFNNLILKHDLTEAFKDFGYLAHSDASNKLVNSDISLLVINRVPGNEGIITGKIFEYMGAANPILGIGPPNCDAAQLLKETGSGQMFDYDDHIGISNFLKTALQDYTAFKQSFKFDCIKFSRERITEQLAELFNHVNDKH